ncbi:MAG: bifunctional diaminohydroxyphosphoribosylaminopyrimidine deaminase/5-amino-6-(5-phosphoribosylamino)uracil reductase RibD [Bacteroides sp.]|nr:bifunctional diaminohydroxyphosphoribosylaminopyrimidine deaminase/5-amino-6-(5-phosphoribosylamino)uracil reductase RibD [Roseburia sp.]MCM1346096.1 bifunctional diaminohydroxyphosphoribosylaminopyrimidine deaminase/5-amino-6-(5-phosphoribosylamino)uracil reductase RibD [Bacteroides sp.]MCM1422006.1 bifunctional diaminohydroxyphosphoribosylaminopyrimidine deaminase/5-amino-6-(5-phosphoribosylamino)uracil reductase RibD [Bacteroides sp.]
MTLDEMYMRRCLQLAANGRKNAQPNPMVGAVIVHEGKIIGEGYHVRCGEGHAEVNAIASVKDAALLRESTIYVSLEPCSHYGKTPPCADLIIEKGLRRVVVGCVDPFAKVQGRGIQKLREAGIEVRVGVLEEECMRLNKRFMTFHGKHRPFVTLKWAQSADGFIDTPEDKPRAVISDSHTGMCGHKRRAEHQAILVGRRTALLDNPSLTTRNWYGDNPVRIVVDRSCSLPSTLRLFDGEVPTIVFSSSEASLPADSCHAEKIAIDFNADIIPQILDKLYERGIQTLLVEGGRLLLQSFIDDGLWDEAYVETGHILLHEGVKAPVLKDCVLMNSSCHINAFQRVFKDF